MSVRTLTNLNLFVVSGGPGAGKTTTLDELAKAGFQFVPEVARLIMQEQISQEQISRREERFLGLTGRPITELMLQRSIESFKKYYGATKPSFTDRAIPDTLGYARLIGLPDTSRIESVVIGRLNYQS